MHPLFKTEIPKRFLVLLTLAVIILFGSLLALNQELTVHAEKTMYEAVRAEAQYRMFTKIHLEARAAIVYDATNNTILYALRPMERRPIASITKIMTALVGRTILSSTTPITITKADRTEEPDPELHIGDTWTAKDLTQYFLVKSSNDGSQAVCNSVTKYLKNQNTECVTLMNQYAKNKELFSLYFANPSGLDLDVGVPSNFGSAYDIARLLKLAYESYPSLFAVTNQPTVTFTTDKYTYTAKNTDEVLEEIGTVLAGKTGYTDTAGGNLAVLYEPRPGLRVAIVVLGATKDGRFSDMLELVRRTNSYAMTFLGNK